MKITFTKIQRYKTKNKYYTGESEHGQTIKSDNLSSLSYIFSMEGSKYPQEIKDEITRYNRGLGGNFVDVFLKDDLVFMGTQHMDRDDVEVSLTQKQFIELIDQWYEITKDQPKVVYLCHDEKESRYWFQTNEPV